MSASRIAGFRVLIVEDEAVVAEGIKERLQRHQCEVVGIVDAGEAAIENARTLRPELVLMDIRLRGRIDGVDAAVAIQQQLMIPVVFLTAHSDTVTLDRAMRTSPAGYLLKPFREAELLVAVEVAVKRDREARRLRERNLSFAQILASLDEATVTLDADDRVVFLNAAAQRLIGRIEGDLTLTPLTELLGLRGADGAPVTAQLLAAARGNVSPLELPEGLVLESSSGATPVRGSIAPILDFQTHRLGTVIALRDVSRRVELERHAVEAAQLTAVRLMAGGVAHELNNALSWLGIEQDLLAAALGAPGEEVRGHLDGIRGAFEKASKIARRLQGLGRCGHAHPEPVCLGALARTFAERVALLIDRDAAFQASADPDTTWVRADAAQLEQALVQLALNARDASPPGKGIVVAVGVRPMSDGIPPTQEVWIEVRDFGAGLPASIRDRVLAPFVTTKGSGALGLGLTLVQDLLEQNAGRLEVESTPEQGATFRMVFPAIPTPHRARRSDGPPSLATGKVLLVDDDHMILKVIAQLLEMMGFIVAQAADGRQALDLWSAEPEAYCLVVTDLMMPVMGGRELIMAIRQRDPEAPVIVMSGYDGGWVGERPLDATILRKPFRAKALQSAIQGTLAARGRRMARSAQG